ncbi:hypothetical protein HK098_005055 [Nowakowskiella sp. JEL0407]|nr:hypothetical protein HK098_005055 [Nowakowskiella sp. JEL0407]
MAYSKNVILFRAIIFHIFHTLFAVAIILNGFILCPLAFHSNATYRYFVQKLERAYSCVVALNNYVFVDNQMIISGDRDWLRDYNGKMVVMSNHQIYPDWWYITVFAWFYGHGGDLKILMVEWLKNVPIFGTGFWIFEYVLLKQKWDKDRGIIDKALKKAKKATVPLWMLIFPEGTLNTPNNVEKSKAFAKKNNIAVHPTHVILPRSTGLFFCINSLRPDIEYLTDLTIGYYPLKPTDIPYDMYLMDTVFHEGRCPEKVYVHVRKYLIKDIPGFSETDKFPAGASDKEIDTIRQQLFSDWLQKIYMEKDEMIIQFFKDGSFQNVATATADTTEVRPFPRPMEFLEIFGMYLSLFVTIPFFWYLLKFAIGVVWTLFFRSKLEFASGGDL